MEFPQVGENCHVSNCNVLSFLPLKCDRCFQVFCKNHALPYCHCCQILELNTSEENKIKEESKQCQHFCTLKNCERWEFTPIYCSYCNGRFCLHHKHQIDHECPYYLTPNPMAEAAAKVDELIAPLRSKPKANKTNGNHKLEAKVQLMKLKASAVGNKDIPLDERVYFRVFPPKCKKSQQSLAVYVSYRWTIGKMLDFIADLAKVTNHNNESPCILLRLFSYTNGHLLSPFDKSVRTIFEEGHLCDGQSIILEYTSKDTNILESYKDY